MKCDFCVRMFENSFIFYYWTWNHKSTVSGKKKILHSECSLVPVERREDALEYMRVKIASGLVYCEESAFTDVNFVQV